MFISRHRDDVTTTIEFCPGRDLIIAIGVAAFGLVLFDTGRKAIPMDINRMAIGAVLMGLGAFIVFRVIRTIYRLARRGWGGR